jgi:phage gp29-like protein
MSLTDRIKSASAAFFKPKSPLDGNAPLPSNMMSASAAADYRLDLTLQNLLSIGAEFSPDDIIQLRKRARYGDPRWLYSLYDEMMRLGPAPQVLKAREAIKGTDTIWKSTPEEADEDENSTDPEDKTARLVRDVTEEAWGKWLPDLKSHLSTKFFYGLAACQVMWKPRAIEGKWSRVTDIRPIPARRFRLDPETLRFKFLTNPYSWEGPFVDDLQKTGKLIFVEVGSDVEPLDQRGLLYQCLIPWAIMQYTVRWRAKRLQNFGMPPVMVKYPKNDPSNKEAADQLADMLASGTRASVPEDLEATLLAAPGAGSKGGDPYEANIEWCEREYDKIILGHSQVSGVQVGAGSRSSSGDAIGLFKDVTNSRAKELDTDLAQQAYRPYVAREFGEDIAEEHTPRTVSSVFERDSATELASVALQLSQAGAGGAIAVEDLVERTSLKVAEDGELTLAGNVKGETPSPNEVGALNKAQPAGLGEQAEVTVDGEGKAVQKIKKAPVQPVVMPGAPGQPGAKPAFGKPAFGKPAAAAPAAGQPKAAPVGQPKAPKAPKKFTASRRERFAVAGAGLKPVVTFGEGGITLNPALPFETLRGMVTRIIDKAALVGEPGVTFSVVEDKQGVAKRLGRELAESCEVVFAAPAVPELNDERIEHLQQRARFYSEDQLRDENGRWVGGQTASTPEAHGRAAAYHMRRYNDAIMEKEPHIAGAHLTAAHVHEAARDNPSFSEWARRASVGANGMTEASKHQNVNIDHAAMRLVAGTETFMDMGSMQSPAHQALVARDTRRNAKRLAVEAKVAVRMKKLLATQKQTYVAKA